MISLHNDSCFKNWPGKDSVLSKANETLLGYK